MDEARVNTVSRLMLEFAASSGLTGDRAPRRYLWTDAHAVCNFLTLERQTGDADFRRLAIALADQVHQVLGRHRNDDDRTGWISGLDETDGQQHPTIGGLRIGKPFPERRFDEAYDERSEWEQDGQYYHYLTKWMHALLQLARATEEPRYLVWAAELALTACARFRAATGPARLYWKMSIDLSYPLVLSSGLHDPLDGLVTALTLRAAGADRQISGFERLIAELSELCRGKRWHTDDPLGIGGLLFDAARLAQLDSTSSGIPNSRQLLTGILEAADLGLVAFLRSASLRQPGSHRLAFRELGLSIGLHGLALMDQANLPAGTAILIDRLQTHRALGRSIEQFWSDPAQQRTATWLAHGDINAVMLATSLAPAGFLETPATTI
jgi:hypothetical protein